MPRRDPASPGTPAATTRRFLFNGLEHDRAATAAMLDELGDPLIVAWPAIPGPGAVRPQYVHAIDVPPTILDVTGTALPPILNGVPQEPRACRSFARSLTHAAAREHRETQYYEQFACRAIYHQGWKAVTSPSPRTGGRT